MIDKMLSRWIALLLLSVGCGLAQTISIPDSSAGRTLRAWLDAFNSGDRARIEAYIKTIDPSQSVDGMLEFRRIGHFLGLRSLRLI